MFYIYEAKKIFCMNFLREKMYEKIDYETGTYRMSYGRRFGLGGGYVSQVLDHLFGIFRFTGTGFARAKNRLVLTIYGHKQKM